jgi:hypothetical protein
MNATTKDLARIAASVARDPLARASRVDVNGSPRTSGHPARAVLHLVVTIGLAIAAAVLAFKWSDERELRRQAEARATEASVARLPTTLFGERQMLRQFAISAIQPPDVVRNGGPPTVVATATAATSAKGTPDFQKQLRKQLADPTTRSAIRAQQRSMAMQMYGDLLRSWHLSAVTSDRVLDLLAEQQLREIDRALAASDAANQGPETQPGGARRGAQSDATGDDLSALLTETQRTQLSQQQATLGERATVSSLADELSLAQMPMTDSQQQQLIQVMYDERTAVPAPNVDNTSVNSPDTKRALDDWQSALDQRVHDRAATILTSDQQTRFEQFMTRQREARSAFASFEVAQSGDNAGGAAPPSATAPPQGP